VELALRERAVRADTGSSDELTGTIAMAYPECPDCRVPQLVPDEADAYTCFTCYANIRFYRCPNCTYQQSIVKRWSSFACGRCERKVDPDPRPRYSTALRARDSSGVGYMYPKL
jgi:hypothetical protein